MVVEKDVSINEIPIFSGNTLVGHFCDKEVREIALTKWMEINFYLVLGYKTIFHILVCGWLCFIF
jgi:hypothetical protein